MSDDELIADARRLNRVPHIHFDTKGARRMIGALLRALDAKPPELEEFDWKHDQRHAPIIEGIRTGVAQSWHRGFRWGVLAGFVGTTAGMAFGMWWRTL